MIILKGTPPSTSAIYKYRYTGKFVQGYMNSAGKDAKLQYQWEMKSQWKKPIITDSIKLEIKYYFPNKIRRDIDNFMKIIFDSATGIIWEDDCLINELHAYKYIDKNLPRVELIIN